RRAVEIGRLPRDRAAPGRLALIEPRPGGEPAGGVCAVRTLENVGPRTRVDHSPGIHDQQALAEAGDGALAMGGPRGRGRAGPRGATSGDGSRAHPSTDARWSKRD